MRLMTSVRVLIITAMLSVVTITFAESAKRMAPTAPPTIAMLGGVGSDFIIANERKYMITSKTVIINKRGDKISRRLLKPKSEVHIEFKFVEKGDINVPVAHLIKVLSEP